MSEKLRRLVSRWRLPEEEGDAGADSRRNGRLKVPRPASRAAPQDRPSRIRPARPSFGAYCSRTGGPSGICRGGRPARTRTESDVSRPSLVGCAGRRPPRRTVEALCDTVFDAFLPFPFHALLVVAVVAAVVGTGAWEAFRRIDRLAQDLRERNDTLESRNAVLRAV